MSNQPVCVLNTVAVKRSKFTASPHGRRLRRKGAGGGNLGGGERRISAHYATQIHCFGLDLAHFGSVIGPFLRRIMRSGQLFQGGAGPFIRAGGGPLSPDRREFIAYFQKRFGSIHG